MSARPDPFAPEALADELERVLGRPPAPRVMATLVLASQAHAGQWRRARDGAEPLPYIIHPFTTALLCLAHYQPAHLPDDLDTVLCVALAHDVLEDTPTEPGFLEQAAGTRARQCVEALTRDEAGPGAERMTTEEFSAGILAAGRTAVFVKICDSMSNLGGPEQIPPGLLGRLVKKARAHYLPMLDVCDLGAALRAAYQEAIATAEDELQRGEPASSAED